MTRIFNLALVLGIASTLSFAAVIDNFNGSASAQIARDSVIDSVAVVDTLGGRTIFANKSEGNSGIYLDATIGAQVEDYFSGSAGVGAAGRTGANYAGMWSLTSADLGFSIELIGNDLPGSSISFWLSDGTNMATSPDYALAVVGPGDPSQVIIALFSGFSGIESVNMSAITSLGFVNTHVANGDLGLDNFGTQVIPEPGTYAMMAAGLVGLYFIRRRRA
ncbi:MAG: PEP-CTERM sorting domain-containing protein [Bryobacteraceae bacterium]|nr:PEP-CTERM sorting domain-containing protein [Bryobacteraceae bacterium]